MAYQSFIASSHVISLPSNILPSTTC